MGFPSFGFLHLVRKEWQRNYRYNGGFSALARCMAGTVRLHLRPAKSNSAPQQPALEAITFSVVPNLTALWVNLMRRVFVAQPLRVIIGDCSGGLDPSLNDQFARVFPVLNYKHGYKLDLFLQKVCTGEYIIVCDDDVFWLNDIPWKWTLAQFEADPQVAVVSLMPREHVSGPLKGKVQQSMGSYCLILRRDVWLRENLSFTIVHPPPEEAHGWFYDTADYAQLKLLERGYKVIIAPPEIRQHLVTFEGISSWAMRIQEKRGAVLKQIKVDPSIRPAKALRTVYMTRSLSALASHYLSCATDPTLIRPDFLEKAEQACKQFLDVAQAREIQIEVQRKIARLRARLEPLSASD